MRKKFIGWAVLASVMLVASTICGLAVRSFVGPDIDYDPYQMAGARMAAPPPQRIRYDLVNRPPTAFDPPEQPGDRESQELLRPLRAISAEKDVAELSDRLAQFDTMRMAEEEVALGFYLHRGQPTQLDIDTAAFDIRGSVAQLLTDRPALFPTGAAQVLRVRWSPDRREAQLLARHTATADGRKTVCYTRWWMARNGRGEWLVYDFDFRDTHLRFLATRSYLVNHPVKDGLPLAANGPEPADLASFQNYLQAVYWLSLTAAGNDPATVNATACANGMVQPAQIPAVSAARHAMQQRLAALNGNPNGAATYANVVRREYPDTPSNVLAEATARNARKDYAAALERVRAYRELIGDNPEAYREEAKAEAGLKSDPKAAIAVLRKGLDVFPGDRALLIDLARRVPADERETVGELIAKTATADVLGVAAGLFEAQFPSIVDGLATGFLRVKPQDSLAQVRGVQAKVALSQTKAAGELLSKFRTANPAAWPATRAAILAEPRAFREPGDYYDLFARAGEAEDAYRTIARRSQNLAWTPPNSPGIAAAVKQLDALNTAHAAKFPNDPELLLWQAHVSYARGDFAAADAKLATAMAKLKKPATDDRTAIDPEEAPAKREAREWEWTAYRRLRTQCLAKLGKWKQAYEQLPPAGDTFDQLANRFIGENDEFSLAELLELHAQKHPDDQDLPYWRGEVQFLRKDYEAARKFFLAAQRQKADANAAPDYRTHERLVRTYLRLKRPADATAQMDWFEPRPLMGGEPKVFLHAVIAVAGDDPDTVLDILDQNPAMAAALYFDPDATALLTKPIFTPVRQKYPPPVR
ncbi:tetratricopeptide repeat protein [Limnoglobus roseus]|uniref:Tetratricopeptide repeat protein n=1 Tax=Limnoglobus roseus TaxID=2598579 RepID=A0A5C1A8W7_9BACT|nr:hypothetical protein [Limnoglobus roseus]QEL13548.1 tetratricopeptide repeat protein [Limnoglobus roseus]